MSCSKRSYFSLFFTHTVQRTENGFVRYWADKPLNSTYAGGFYPHENYLFLTVSAEQPAGQLKIAAPTARVRFDFSTGVSLDSSITLDSASFPVADYSFVIPAPIKPSFCRVQFSYRGQAQEQEFPKVFSIRQGREESTYPHSLWWPGCPTPEVLVNYKEEALKLVDLSSGFTLDQEERPVLTGPNAVPGNMELFTWDDGFESQLETPVPSDTVDDYPYFLDAKAINISNLPEGDFTVSLEDATVVYSQFSIAPNSLALPSESLGSSMQGAPIAKVGLALIALCATGDSPVLYSTIDSLLRVWKDLLENTITVNNELFVNQQGRGILPEYLSKTPAYYAIPHPTSAYGAAWLGLGLIRACKFFKAGAPDQRGYLPEGLNLLLKHHAYYVAGLTNNSSGAVYQGVTTEGAVVAVEDLRATPICCMFLSEFLTLEYDSFIHHQAARLEQRTRSLYFSPYESFEEFDSVEEKLEILASLFLWHNQQTGSDLNARFYDNFLTLPNLIRSSENPLRYTALFSYAAAAGDYYIELGSGYSAEDTLAELNPDLFVSANSPSDPDLEVSSWMLLRKRRVRLVAGKSFSLKSEEAAAFQTYAYQLLLQMWPYGLRWMSEEAEDYKRGNLGSLLYAQASLTYGWALFYFTYLKSLSISDCQGAAVDWWYESLGQRRGYLVQDEDLRAELTLRLRAESSTLPAVLQHLSTLYATRDLYIVEASAPDFYWLKGTVYQSSRFNPANINHLDIVLKTGNSLVHSNSGPGFIFPPTADIEAGGSEVETFEPWSNYFPKLLIYTYTHCPGLLREAENLCSAGVGLEVALYHHHVSAELKDNFFSIQEGLFLDVDLENAVLFVDVTPALVEEYCGDILQLTAIPNLPPQTVVWEQIAGNPVTLLNPNDLVTFVDRSNVDGPFQFRVTVTFAELEASAVGTAYTTPTTIYSNVGLARSPENLGQAFNFVILPTNIDQGYQLELGAEFRIGFNPPSINTQYVLSYDLVRFNGGVYQTVSSSQGSLPELDGYVMGGTFFVRTNFVINGRPFSTLSEILPFNVDVPNTYVDNLNAPLGISVSTVNWVREGLENIQLFELSEAGSFGLSPSEPDFVRLPLEVENSEGESNTPVVLGLTPSEVEFVRQDLSGTTTG